MSATVPPALDDAAACALGIDSLTRAMRAKLEQKRDEDRHGWHKPDQCSVHDLAEKLVEHLAKGDPVDIANFCMMLHARPNGAEAIRRAWRRHNEQVETAYAHGIRERALAALDKIIRE